MMAHDPAVVDIKRGGRRPGADLVLVNFLHYDNTQRALSTWCFHTLFDYVMTSVSEHL